MVIERDIRSKSSYINYIINGEVDIMKKILELKLQDEKDQWVRVVTRYFGELEISLEQLGCMKRNNIRMKVQEWGSTKRRGDMEKKSTLSTCRKYKSEICEEVMYDHTFRLQLNPTL